MSRMRAKRSTKVPDWPAPPDRETDEADAEAAFAGLSDADLIRGLLRVQRIRARLRPEEPGPDYVGALRDLKGGSRRGTYRRLLRAVASAVRCAKRGG